MFGLISTSIRGWEQSYQKNWKKKFPGGILFDFVVQSRVFLFREMDLESGHFYFGIIPNCHKITRQLSVVVEYTYTHMYVCIYIYMYIYVHTYATYCMYLCIHVYLHSRVPSSVIAETHIV